MQVLLVLLLVREVHPITSVPHELEEEPEEPALSLSFKRYDVGLGGIRATENAKLESHDRISL